LYYVYATGGGDGVLPIFSGPSTTSGFTKVVAPTPTGAVVGKTRSFSQPQLLTCGNAAGWKAIDPTVYVSAAGVSYLVWKRGHYRPGFPDGTFEIRARELAFSGATVNFAGGSNPSLTLVAHGGKVWLFVSRGRFDTNDYHTDVWMARSFGPGFTFSNHVMATGQGYGYGPGGAEVLTDTDAPDARHARHPRRHRHLDRRRTARRLRTPPSGRAS